MKTPGSACWATARTPTGEIWKQIWSTTFVASELPGVVIGSFGFSDLLAGTAIVSNLYKQKKAHYATVPRLSDSNFTPDAWPLAVHADAGRHVRQ